MTKLVDLSDLVVTKDEALDLLGDLINVTEVGLFGEKSTKVATARPQWVIDGLVVVRKTCNCKSCGKSNQEINSLILVSESLVAFDGTVIKSHKTAYPETLRHQNIDFESLEVIEEYIHVADITFCSHCILDKQHVLLAFGNQRKTMTNHVCKAEAARAEQDLLDLMAELDRQESL